MDYRAPYPGNFICSLNKLEDEIKEDGGTIVYVFTECDLNANWIRQFMQEKEFVYVLSTNKWKSLFQLKNLIQKHHVNIVHSHFVGCFYQLPVNYLKKIFRKKIVMVRHLHNQYPIKSRVIEFIQKLLMPSDIIIGCSLPIAEDYIECKMNNSNVVYSIPNAIQFERLDTYEILKKEDFDIDQNSHVFLIFGFDFYRKGVDLAVLAMRNLISKGENVVLMISVAVNQFYVKDEILKILQCDEIPLWIRFIEPRNDIATYYRLCNTFVSPSRSEGLCYSLVEAAYCGCKLIASNCIGQNLQIPHKLTFESENLEEFEQKCKYVLQPVGAENETQRIQEQKDVVIQQFQLSVWAKRVVWVYQNIGKKSKHIIDLEKENIA